MKWTILNTLICPQSGIAFSAISSLRFLKFIMWYEADVILLPGESIRLYSSRVLINDQYHSLKIYNITVYDEAQWEKLRERPSCPYHAGGERSDSCFYQSFCTIKRCPNNIPRSEPSALASPRRRSDTGGVTSFRQQGGQSRLDACAAGQHEVASPQARIGEKRIARSARLLNQ